MQESCGHAKQPAGHANRIRAASKLQGLAHLSLRTGTWMFLGALSALLFSISAMSVARAASA
jgi:hypothetical protein